jgi:anti-anti-sigma factor
MALSMLEGSTPVAGLTVTVSVEGSSTVLALRGVGDLATLPVLLHAMARVIAENHGDVIVDLAETEFLDTASVRIAGRASQYLHDRGRHLTIRSASRQAVMVLAAFGLSHLCDAHEMSSPEPRGGSRVVGGRRTTTRSDHEAVRTP